MNLPKDTIEEKKKKLTALFDADMLECNSIKEQIKGLQMKLQDKATNMTRLQGAYALLDELSEEQDPAPKTIETPAKAE